MVNLDANSCSDLCITKCVFRSDNSYSLFQVPSEIVVIPSVEIPKITPFIDPWSSMTNSEFKDSDRSIKRGLGRMPRLKAVIQNNKLFSLFHDVWRFPGNSMSSVGTSKGYFP